MNYEKEARLLKEESGAYCSSFTCNIIVYFVWGAIATVVGFLFFLLGTQVSILF